MGKTKLGKNRGSRKSDTMQSKFSILEMEDVGNLEMDMNEEGMRNKEVANQPKNPMTQATFKGKGRRPTVLVHKIPLTGSDQGEALNQFQIIGCGRR